MKKQGGLYQYVVMQNAAAATGNGTEILPTQMDDGSLTVLTMQIVGITTATITFEASIDGTNYVAVSARNLNTQALATTATTNGLYRANIAGYKNFRARISAWTSGTIYVYGLATSDGEAGHVAISSIAAGTNNIGKVDVNSITAGETHLGEVGGNMLSVAVEFTRPADTTAYAANDVVSDSTSATTMQAIANAARVSGGSGYIVGIRVSTDKKSITPRIRVHFYNTNGATLSADNAAWQEKYADGSKRVFSYDMPAMTTGADTANSDMSRAIDTSVRIPYVCAATSLYYVLETLDAFTPASGEKITVTVFLDRN